MVAGRGGHWSGVHVLGGGRSMWEDNEMEILWKLLFFKDYSRNTVYVHHSRGKLQSSGEEISVDG